MNKDKQFWEYIQEFDVIELVGRIEEKYWEKLKEALPKNFIWKCSYAIK